MTIPVLKIKVLPKPVVKGKMDVRFPANVIADDFLTVFKANGAYTFGADYTLLDPSAIIDAASSLIAVYDQSSQSWKVNTVAGLLQQAPYVEQHITGPGPVTIANNAGVVRVNQTVGAAITLNMGPSASKTCPVLISDWKGDAGTNNITINLSGSDKFPGNLTSWKIAGDTGSVFLRPIGGVGYAL